MATANTCSFLQLRFSKQHNFSLFSSSSSSSSATSFINLSNNPSRSSSPLSLPLSSSIRPPHLSSSSISAPTSEISPPISSWRIRNSDDTKMSESPVDVDSIVNPSLRYANIMYFRSAYNVQIVVDEDEPEEVILRRFRREVSKAGVIRECKRRRFFENKQEEKKRKAREAGQRNRRRRSGPRFPPPAGADAAGPKKAVEDDDNWDMPNA